MLLLDTLSGEKKEIPQNRRVSFFVCGPTVYDYAQIGNARTYLAFDMLVRYLRTSGYKVMYIQNITDIDDKIIERAREEGKKPLALSDFFYREYRRDMKSLGITSVSKYAKASKYISQIVRQVKTLIEK